MLPKTFTDYFIFIGLVFLLFVLIDEAHAVPLQIDWENPTTRTDGSSLPISEIKHTVIKWHCPAGENSKIVDAPANSLSVNITMIGLCSFKAKSVDVANLESEWSDVFDIMLTPDAPPSPPTWIEIVIAWIDKLFNRWFA